MGFTVLSLGLGVFYSVFFLLSVYAMALFSLFTLCIISFASLASCWMIHSNYADATAVKETFEVKDGLYRTLLENLPVAIFEINSEGHICFVNKEARHTLKKPMPIP